MLGNMEDEGLIQSFRSNSSNIYYLDKLGKDMLGTSKGVTKTNQVDHYLMRNDYYIYAGCPEDFKVEFEYRFKGEQNIDGIIMKKEMFVRADGYYLKGDIPHFLEVDNTQLMTENVKKIERYKALAKYLGFVEPVIVFYTSSDVRKEKLKKLLKEANLRAAVYVKKDIL